MSSPYRRRVAPAPTAAPTRFCTSPQRSSDDRHPDRNRGHLRHPPHQHRPVGHLLRGHLLVGRRRSGQRTRPERRVRILSRRSSGLEQFHSVAQARVLRLVRYLLRPDREPGGGGEPAPRAGRGPLRGRRPGRFGEHRIRRHGVPCGRVLPVLHVGAFGVRRRDAGARGAGGRRRRTIGGRRTVCGRRIVGEIRDDAVRSLPDGRGR